MAEEILIKKADGGVEPFQSEKLLDSLTRAGASESVREKILKEMESLIQSGMTTQQIYRKAYALLRKKESCTVVARYSLKRAVFALGPSGFPFEAFVGEIYRANGYRVSNGDVIQGRCVEHEIDMLASSSEETIAAEIKFHNHLGIKTDVKVALYVHARFEDLVGHRDPKTNVRIDKGLLITNTKFTSSAEKYSACAGLDMISWDYPKEGSDLHTLIINAGLHPVTCLPSLSKGEAARLLDNNIVLCRDLKLHAAKLSELGISAKKIPILLEEASTLCQSCARV